MSESTQEDFVMDEQAWETYIDEPLRFVEQAARAGMDVLDGRVTDRVLCAAACNLCAQALHRARVLHEFCALRQIRAHPTKPDFDPLDRAGAAVRLLEALAFALVNHAGRKFTAALKKQAAGEEAV